ncbi:malate dehydrogenase [Culex quinquefasciatus]|uniref:Malate dehydrogenase n=1 Tax=Culex quinquefasciatus TaxID=7176 RepID=B0X1B5_CULQU|nr:malate dehydrogenase [Culex quinquefasciatus]|eukprot:XP_001863437.1 malate dehydrogenase [Culex quinquefasciatus]
MSLIESGDNTSEATEVAALPHAHDKNTLTCVVGDNSMVTIACDTLPKAGFLEPKCAFGISMLYIVRPNTFIGEGDKIATLAVRIQEVLKTKTGAGADTLTTAYAEARFALAMAHAMNGKKNNVLEKNLGLPKVNAYGQELLKKDISELKKNIRKGEEFVKNYCDNSGLEEDGFLQLKPESGINRRWPALVLLGKPDGDHVDRFWEEDE